MSGFCENCGGYMKPEESEQVFIDGGGVIETCRDCKKTIYGDRIHKAIEGFFASKTRILDKNRTRDRAAI